MFKKLVCQWVKQEITLLHLFGILFPHINYDARSKSHQEQCAFCLQFWLKF